MNSHMNINDIKMVVLDVDGTLTNGLLTYNDNGLVSKSFNVKDGLAISLLIENGIQVIFLSGSNSKANKFRAETLNISENFSGIKNKLLFVNRISTKYNIPLEQILYIGDDINDIHAMKIVGFTACPQDAVEEVKSISNFISNKKAGFGAVREIIEEFFEITSEIIRKDFSQ
jgi:3-deoxy-D-manno-octulosonate 8-phosphate phosphatase (KDO 8-P phosphatase)